MCLSPVYLNVCHIVIRTLGRTLMPSVCGNLCLMWRLLLQCFLDLIELGDLWTVILIYQCGSDVRAIYIARCCVDLLALQLDF